MDMFHDFPCYVRFKMHCISVLRLFQLGNFGFDQCHTKTGQRRNTFMEVELRHAQKLFVFKGLFASTVFFARLLTGIYDRQVYISILHVFNSFPELSNTMPYSTP